MASRTAQPGPRLRQWAATSPGGAEVLCWPGAAQWWRMAANRILPSQLGRGTADVVVRVVSQTGIATNTGSTHAISRAGMSYTGSMRVQVRFGSHTVSGLITDFADNDGIPWCHNYTEMASIVLPDAVPEPNARWDAPASTVNASNPVYIRYPASSGIVTPGTDASGMFDGILFDRGDDSGSEANGIWQVVTATSTAAPLLARGFGVVRGEDAVSPRPGEDDGSIASARLIASEIRTASASLRSKCSAEHVQRRASVARAERGTD